MQSLPHSAALPPDSYYHSLMFTPNIPHSSISRKAGHIVPAAAAPANQMLFSTRLFSPRLVSERDAHGWPRLPIKGNTAQSALESSSASFNTSATITGVRLGSGMLWNRAIPKPVISSRVGGVPYPCPCSHHGWALMVTYPRGCRNTTASRVACPKGCWITTASGAFICDNYAGRCHAQSQDPVPSGWRAMPKPMIVSRVGGVPSPCP